jgi:hypothetical protein
MKVLGGILGLWGLFKGFRIDLNGWILVPPTLRVKIIQVQKKCKKSVKNIEGRHNYLIYNVYNIYKNRETI